MAEVLLFHHALGLTPGCLSFADALRAAGHLVHAGTIAGAQLFLYPGDRHLFTDSSLPDYDESAATLLRQRVLDFLDGIEEST